MSAAPPYGPEQPGPRPGGGYPAAPTPHAGGYDPYAAVGPDQGPRTGAAQTPPPPSRRTGAVAIVIVIAVILVLGTALGVGASILWPGGSTVDPTPTSPDPAPATTDPTPAPTPTPEPTQDPASSEEPTDAGAIGEIDGDGFMTGPGYVFAAPAGWTVAPDSGESNSGRITDGGGSEISVYDFGGSVVSCENDIEALQIWVPGTIEALEGREIGGVEATGTSLVGDAGDYYASFCTDVDGRSVGISLHTTTDARDDATTLFADVLDSWEWT
jgi:hypothetical protein